MKINDIVHGFKVEYSQELPEISAVLWRMKYQKNGADLVWLERGDDNKTFAIAFKTIPGDDTGVFHILEHSVLNGSQKYPVKEPFVELIKGSMATFLNAFTFPDKTMYPVSSRNPQDFLNLIDVYMDAVLHPLSISDPHAFRQEGWHYELENEDAPLSCNGVVYNEMKGAFASPDSVLSYEMNRLLFPDNCYGCESGGHPDHITELTYENYLAGHHRFYHPSNSRIILDGDMDIDSVLKKLDGFLCEYGFLDVDSDIPVQKPVAPEEKTAYYEIGPEEDEKNKAILASGWVFGDYTDLEKSLAFSALDRLLTGSNEAPLSKALLDAGLCEDVYFQKMDGIQQIYSYLVIRNADPARKDEIWRVVDSVVSELCEKGLDKKLLHSSISRMEFAMREKDYGGMPRGLVFAMSTLESWLYGGDPAQNLQGDELFKSLRQKIDDGWFDGFLRSVMLECSHRARLVLLPSKTLGEEKRAAEEERLAKVKSGLSKEETEKIISDFAALRQRQELKDTPEQLAMLPKLSVSDIPKTASVTPQNISEICGIKVINQPLVTQGITYLNLYFSIADIEKERLPEVAFFASLLGQAATEHYSAVELQSELQSALGRFAVSTESYGGFRTPDDVAPYITVRVSLLDSSKADAIRLIDEILNRTDFSDSGFIYNLIRQNRIGLEESIAMSGDSYALMRTFAQSSAKGAVGEALHGISYLRWLQKTDSGYEDKKAELCSGFEALKKVFSKARLTIGVTGELDNGFISGVISVLGDGKMSQKAEYTKNPAVKEGFVIPAEIGFAAESLNLSELDSGYTGTARVAAQLLTYDYLWNEVRVKGGAYGTRMTSRVSGDVGLSSYRDPSPGRSLDVFKKTGRVLREFYEKGESVDKYIISTIAAIEPVMTPRSEGDRAIENLFLGRTAEDIQRERAEILGTTPKQLEEFSHKLDAVTEKGGVCVVGGKAAIDACKDIFDTVETVSV